MRFPVRQASVLGVGMLENFQHPQAKATARRRGKLPLEMNDSESFWAAAACIRSRRLFLHEHGGY